MVLSSILWVIGSLFILLLILFFIPWHLYFKGVITICQTEKSASGKMLIGGQNFGIGFRFYPEKSVFLGPVNRPFLSITIRKPNKAKATKAQKQVSQFQLKYLKLGKAVLRVIHLERLDIHGKVGFPDPMYTGLVYGYSHTITHILPDSKVNIQMKPAFNNQWDTQLDGTIRIKFLPAFVTWQAAKTYFKFKY